MNAGHWWSAAALVGVLAALAFHAGLFFFTADKSMRKQWIIDRKSDQIQFTVIHCQLTALSLNLVRFTGKKG